MPSTKPKTTAKKAVKTSLAADLYPPKEGKEWGFKDGDARLFPAGQVSEGWSKTP
jgi:hypothetical protein